MSQRTRLQMWMRPDIVKRSVKVSLIVGSILTLVNQGDVIATGEVTLAVMGKILLTFLVPYCVSSYAGVSALLESRDHEEFHA